MHVCRSAARPAVISSGATGRFAGRLLCRALCQGAALHYLNATNGVKDFDVWSFYAERDDGPFPYRWRGTADFGPSEFGRYPGDPRSFTGRRVDLPGRSLDARTDAEPVTTLRDYLSAARTASAKALAAKAAILIEPHQLAGGSSGPWPGLRTDVRFCRFPDVKTVSRWPRRGGGRPAQMSFWTVCRRPGPSETARPGCA
jgi:hypothetical protein